MFNYRSFSNPKQIKHLIIIFAQQKCMFDVYKLISIINIRHINKNTNNDIMFDRVEHIF